MAAGKEGKAMEDFRWLLGSICVRPQMYVAGGTFQEVAAYIDGYEHGIRLRGAAAGREMTRFGAWMAQRFGYSPTVGWSSNMIEHCGGSGAQALRRLPELYDEFIAERSRPGRLHR